MCGGSNTFDTLDPIGRIGTERTGGKYDPLDLYGHGPDPNAAANAAAAAEAARQAQIQKSLNQVNALFSSPERQQQYTDYGNNTFDLLKTGLDQNARTAGHSLEDGLVRTGNIGGSEDVIQHGKLQQDYSQGLLHASDQAQQAAAQLKAQDYALEGNLDNAILGGMSSTTAAQQANQQLQANLQGAQATVAPTALDQTFGDLANAYLNGKANTGTQAANAALNPSLGSTFAAQSDPAAQWGVQWLDNGGPN